MHHGWAGERLGQENHVRELVVDLADQPFPEGHRLGVWVVDAENLDSTRNPELDYSQNFEVNALRVIIEVDWVDVLVLLRWVLGIGNGAVGTSCEPLRVGLNPWVIRRSLQSQIHGNLEAEAVGLLYKGSEVLFITQVRVNCVVSAGRRADCPR